MSKKGKLTWPEGRRGMCGDRANETRWAQPRDVAARYVAGSVIELDALIATNHLGRFDVRVCPLGVKGGEQADKQCKSLTRADGKGAADAGKKYWFLPFVKKWGGGNYGGDPPMYGDGRCVFLCFFVCIFSMVVVVVVGSGFCRGGGGGSAVACNTRKDCSPLRCSTGPAFALPLSI
jgi:hypothetical protein